MPRKDLESIQKAFRFLPAMSLHDTDDDIYTVLGAALSVGKHFVGLADPRRHAEKYLQPSAPLPPGVSQQRIRVGAKRLVVSHQLLG